jgi:hypothetical protein
MIGMARVGARMGLSALAPEDASCILEAQWRAVWMNDPR